MFLKTKKSLSLKPLLKKEEDNADAKKKALFWLVAVVRVLLFLDNDSAALSMHNTKSFNDDEEFWRKQRRSFLGFHVVSIKP